MVRLLAASVGIALALLLVMPGVLAEHNEVTIPPGSAHTVQKHLEKGEVLSVAWDSTGKVNFYIKDPDGITVRLQNEVTFGVSVVEAGKTGAYSVTWENTEALPVRVGYDLDFLRERLSTFALAAIVGVVAMAVVLMVVIVLLVVSSDRRRQRAYYAHQLAPPYAPMAYVPPAASPVACTKCGAAADAQASYCSRCGSKLNGPKLNP